MRSFRDSLNNSGKSDEELLQDLEVAVLNWLTYGDDETLRQHLMLSKEEYEIVRSKLKSIIHDVEKVDRL